MEIFLRFLAGGFIVTGFAVLGDIMRPKSFSGIFTAAPSVALATLGLTLHYQGAAYADAEAHSMIAGSAGFLCYAVSLQHVLYKYSPPVMLCSFLMLFVWGVAAFAGAMLLGWL